MTKEEGVDFFRAQHNYRSLFQKADKKGDLQQSLNSKLKNYEMSTEQKELYDIKAAEFEFSIYGNKESEPKQSKIYKLTLQTHDDVKMRKDFIKLKSLLRGQSIIEEILQSDYNLCCHVLPKNEHGVMFPQAYISQLTQFISWHSRQLKICEAWVSMGNYSFMNVIESCFEFALSLNDDGIPLKSPFQM